MTNGVKSSKTIIPKRGEIYMVNFDPTIGSEIKKTWPALILQNNIANHYSPITIIAAITSQFGEPLYPTEVLIKEKESRLKQNSVVLLNQIRTIDKQRLIKRLGVVDKKIIDKINKALGISLGLDKI